MIAAAIIMCRPVIVSLLFLISIFFKLFPMESFSVGCGEACVKSYLYVYDTRCKFTDLCDISAGSESQCRILAGKDICLFEADYCAADGWGMIECDGVESG